MLVWPVSEQLRYVRGFSDGEGGPRLYYHKDKRGVKRYANIRSVVISNTVDSFSSRFSAFSTVSGSILGSTWTKGQGRAKQHEIVMFS